MDGCSDQLQEETGGRDQQEAGPTAVDGATGASDLGTPILGEGGTATARPQGGLSLSTCRT